MRAHIRTEVTLDTVVRIPNRYVYCDTTFLVCSRTGRSCTVNVILECGYREVVTFLSVYSSLNVVNEVDNILAALCSVNHVKAFVFTVLPALRNFHFYKSLSACIDRCPVLHNNIFTLTAVSSLCSCFHKLVCLVSRDDLCQLEECGLKDRVDTGRAHACLDTKFNTVDGVEFDVVVSDKLLNLSR